MTILCCLPKDGGFFFFHAEEEILEVGPLVLSMSVTSDSYE